MSHLKVIEPGLITTLAKSRSSSKHLSTGEIISLGLFYDFESSYYFPLLCHNSPDRSYAVTSFLRFLDHTQSDKHIHNW